MKRLLKILLLNLAIIVCAVVAYSDGFLALRPGDPSILKAGLSIITGLVLGAGLVGGNYALLKAPASSPSAAQLPGDTDVEALLKKYSRSGVFGSLAKTTLGQLNRIRQSAQRTTEAIAQKFEAGSMTADRFTAVIEAAGETAAENIRDIALRMQMFDEDEYRRLISGKDENIPADIKQQQLALHQKNADYIRRSIATNEELILKMDTLTLEISDKSSRNENDADELADEITKLTQELKFYS